MALQHLAELRQFVAPPLAQREMAIDRNGVELRDVASLREAALYHATAAGALLGVEAPRRCTWQAESERDRVAWLAAKFEAVGAHARERQVQYTRITADYERTDDIVDMQSKCEAATQLLFSPGVILWPQALESCSGRYKELYARRHALRAPPRQQQIAPAEEPPQLLQLTAPANFGLGEGKRLAVGDGGAVAEQQIISLRRQQQLTGATHELVLRRGDFCPFLWDWPCVKGITARARLTEIYECFNPRKLSDIPKLLAECDRGSHHSVAELVRKVEDKYINPASPADAESEPDGSTQPTEFVGRFSQYIGMTITELGGPVQQAELGQPELGVAEPDAAPSIPSALQPSKVAFGPPPRTNDGLLPSPGWDGEDFSYSHETDEMMFDDLRDTEPLFQNAMRESRRVQPQAESGSVEGSTDAAIPEGTPPSRSHGRKDVADATSPSSPATPSEGSDRVDDAPLDEGVDETTEDDDDGIRSMRSSPESQWLCALSAPMAQVYPALYSKRCRPLRLRLQVAPSKLKSAQCQSEQAGKHNPSPRDMTLEDARVEKLVKRIDTVANKPDGGTLFVEVRNVEIDTPSGDIVWLGVYLERARCAELKGTLDSLRKLLRKLARSVSRLPEELKDSTNTACQEASQSDMPLMAQARVIADAMEALMQYGGGDGEWLRSRDVAKLLGLGQQARTAFSAAATKLSMATSRAAVPAPRQV